MKYDIIIRNASYLDGDIAIEDGIIHIIEAGNDDTADKTISNSDLLWMPVFADGHIHTSQQLLRGRLLDEKPVIWKRVNVPFESRLDEEDSELSALIAAIEMIKSGTGLFVDAGGKFPAVFASAYEKAGLKGRVARFSNDNAPESLRLSADKVIEETVAVKGYKNISPILSVTALTAASKNHFHTIFEAARELSIPVEVHMNEYASEVNDFISVYGSRPFEYLEEEGLLDVVKMIAPHCIFLSEREKEIIGNHDIIVIHCPFSNCGKGVPATPSLLAKGIAVGFGSDGAGHGGLDIFKEMRLFRGVINATLGTSCADSSIMSAETLLSMATQGGAEALEASGVIADGSPADIMAIDVSAPHLFPTQNIVHSIVESADGHDVDTMIIDGRIIMEGREVLTISEEEVKDRAKRRFAEKPWLVSWPSL